MRRYLAIPGALLLITAFIRAATSVQWDRTGMLLAVAGTVIVLLTIAMNWREVIEWIRDPRGVFAVTTGIAVALFIAALVMLNIAAWYHPWSVDLTASGRNEVGAETRRVLQRLTVPVVLQQFGRASSPSVDALLRGFERETRRIRVEFVDVDRDRQLATRYGVVKLGTVVVSAGDKFRKVEDANEQALVTGVLQVTSNQERLVCFVTGHGERGLADGGASGLSLLAATLAAGNYRAEPVSLLEDVRSDCASIVIAGPTQPFTPQEITRLDTYYSAHGRIALLLEPDPSPSFAEWLRPRGFDPATGAIVDTSGAGQSVGGGPRTPLALKYDDHPVTRGFEIATMYDGARPLKVIEHPDFGGHPVPLAETGSRSFSTTSTDSSPVFQQGKDIKGPLMLAAALAVGGGGQAEKDTRLAVFGDADFVSNALLRRQGNRDFFLRTLAWLMGEQEATIVAVENRENRRIELTQGTRAWMYIINVGFLPLVPLLAGIIVYLRGRR